MEEDARYTCCCCHIQTGLKFLAALELVCAVLATVVCVWLLQAGAMAAPICYGMLFVCAVKLLSPLALALAVHKKHQNLMIAHCAGTVLCIVISIMLGTVFIMLSPTTSRSGDAVKRVMLTMFILVVVCLMFMSELYLCLRMLKIIDQEQKLLNRRVLSIRRQNYKVERQLQKEREHMLRDHNAKLRET